MQLFCLESSHTVLLAHVKCTNFYPPRVLKSLGLFLVAVILLLASVKFILASHRWQEMTATLDSKILDWYLGLHVRTLDLVGDYAGSERFLLEGDSLLLHCFGDPRIDFEGESYYSL